MYLDTVTVITAMALVGGIIGTFSGLVPGIHVNTLSAVMLASYVPLTELISGFVPDGMTGICISCCIFSASIVHSFVDFVPSVFIGAPDPEEAIGMLPGHRLLAEGRGMAAVRSAAIGSCIGACASTLISVPLQYLLLNGLGGDLDTITWLVLMIVMAMMVLHEDGAEGMFWAAVCIAVSGIAGLICMNADIPSSGPLMDGTLLFPLLTGMFGIPSMLESLHRTDIVEQRDDVRYPVGILPGLKGVIAGTLTGWFPGITSTTGAIVADAVTPERSTEGFIAMTASIGTSASIMMLTTMSVTGSGRSGATIIISEIMGKDMVGLMNGNYLMLLLTAAVATAVGYRMTVSCGKMMVRIIGHIDPKVLNIMCLALVSVLTFLFTGPYGVAVLVAASVTGFLPKLCGVGRIHLTGCLIIPTVLSCLGLKDAVLSILF